MRVCKICGNHITNTRKRSYCSDKCYKIGQTTQYKNKIKFEKYLTSLENRRRTYNKKIDYYTYDNPNPNINDLKNIFEKENQQYYQRHLECYFNDKQDYLNAIIFKLNQSRGYCELSKIPSYRNLHVHHLNGYNWFKQGRCNPNNLIVIDRRLHKLFHDTYGHQDTTKKDFEEFIEKNKEIIDNLGEYTPNQNLKYLKKVR